MAHYIAEKLAALKTTGRVSIYETMLLMVVVDACADAGLDISYRRSYTGCWHIKLAR